MKGVTLTRIFLPAAAIWIAFVLLRPVLREGLFVDPK